MFARITTGILFAAIALTVHYFTRTPFSHEGWLIISMYLLYTILSCIFVAALKRLDKLPY